MQVKKREKFTNRTTTQMKKARNVIAIRCMKKYPQRFPISIVCSTLAEKFQLKNYPKIILEITFWN